MFFSTTILFITADLCLLRIAKRERRPSKREAAAAKFFRSVFDSQHLHSSLERPAYDAWLRERDLNSHLAFQRWALPRKYINANVADLACYAFRLKLVPLGVLPKKDHRDTKLISNSHSAFKATFHDPSQLMRSGWILDTCRTMLDSLNSYAKATK
jgi:hypothetical protein